MVLVALLVGMGSVGSGSVVIGLLLLRFQGSRQALLERDIIQGIVLTCFTGGLQFLRHNVDSLLS